MVKQTLLTILDSVEIGHAPHAADFGDEGANILSHHRRTIPGFELPHLMRQD
jgi:phosphopentomutase